MHKLDHQLLSGEADSDEVQLFTVGGETEDDLLLPTFVKVGMGTDLVETSSLDKWYDGNE